MSNSILLDKSKELALEVIRLCNEIKTGKKESILTNQLVRSGTSVGANIREAFYAHGKADFIAKLHIALKECAESEYWLELLLEGEYTDNRIVLEHCVEVKKILIASINTAKNNKQRTGSWIIVVCIFSGLSSQNPECASTWDFVKVISNSEVLRLYCVCDIMCTGGDHMEIKATCKFDEGSIRALAHLSTFKRFNPQKSFIAKIAVSAFLLLVIITEIFLFGMDSTLITLIIVVFSVIVIDCFMFFFFPKMQYKALAKMKDAENEYVFCDDVLKAFSKSKEYNGEAEIEYSVFVRVYETIKYFFLYQTNNQAFIVDKATIEGGTTEEIKNKLYSFVKGKYILCKY